MRHVPSLMLPLCAATSAGAGVAAILFIYDERWVYAALELAVCAYTGWLARFWWRERVDVRAGRPWDLPHRVWKNRAR